MSRYDDEIAVCARKIDRLGPPRESWLRSDDPYKFAAAMSKCRNSSGTCAQDGFCFLGDCFSKGRQGDEVLGRLREIERRLAALEAKQNIQGKDQP